MKTKTTILFIALTAAFFSLKSQSNLDAIQTKMAFFEFLTGEWEGVGTLKTRDGLTKTIQQHEMVEYKLKNTILNTEGTGTNEKGETVFNAFATIYFDNQLQEFFIHAFKDDGQKTLGSIEIIEEGHFIWRFSPNEKAHIQYDLKVVDNVWTEKGLFSADKTNWIPFWTMELKKIK